MFRLIRIFGVLFSILMTPAYTAVLTFHLEMIPQDMLAPIILSRKYVPFPPVLEVLFLELTIEFLREAGARLPTKVGQTLGIVGGIVIGQASVEAALTSNILLITVALSALASFTTPIYKMSNTIRFLRFPLIILPGFAAIGVHCDISLALRDFAKHLSESMGGYPRTETNIWPQSNPRPSASPSVSGNGFLSARRYDSFAHGTRFLWESEHRFHLWLYPAVVLALPPLGEKAKYRTIPDSRSGNRKSPIDVYRANRAAIVMPAPTKASRMLCANSNAWAPSP